VDGAARRRPVRQLARRPLPRDRTPRGHVVGIVALHAVWDQAYGWAVALSKGVSGVGWALIWPNEEAWAVAPSAEQLLWFNVFFNGILVVLSIVGLIWVLREWRVYGRWHRADQSAPHGAT
jgi:hypothetical protein